MSKRSGFSSRPGVDGRLEDRVAGLLGITGLLGLTAWPQGMPVILRKERPHPGVQLRLTDAAGPAPRTASAPRRTPA